MKIYRLTFLLFLFFTLVIPSYSNTLQFGFGLFKNHTHPDIPDYCGIESRLIYQGQERLALTLNLGISTVSLKENSNSQTASTGYYSEDYLKSPNTQLLPGDFSMMWFELAPTYFIARGISKNNVDIYCGAGFGLYYTENAWDWQTNTSLKTSEEILGFGYYEDKPGLSLGANIHAGIRIPLTANADLNLESKYIYNHTEIEYEINYMDEKNSEYGTRKVDLSSINYSVLLILTI